MAEVLQTCLDYLVAAVAVLVFSFAFLATVVISVLLAPFAFVLFIVRNVHACVIRYRP